MDRAVHLPAELRSTRPGRKYLAVGERKNSGSTTWRPARWPARSISAGQTKQFWKYECFGLAFSPDGVELAGIFETPFKSRLISWDVAKGDVLADHTFDKRLHWNYKGPPVEWLPDRTGILVYGKHLVEHQTGKLVYEVPNMGPGTDRQFHVVGSDQLLEVAHNFQGHTVQVVPLPKAQLEQIIEATPQGLGGAVAARRTAPGDLSARRRTIPTANNVKWTVTADAPPALADRFSSRPIPLQRARNRRAARAVHAARGGHLRRPECGHGRIEYFAKKVLRLERAGPDAGQPLGGLNLCVNPQYRFGESVPSDLSDDGTVLAVLKGRQDSRRVDVWSVAEGQAPGRLAAVCRRSRTGSPGIAKPNQVVWLGLLGSKRLFTLNSSGKLVLWGLPDARPVYAWRTW